MIPSSSAPPTATAQNGPMSVSVPAGQGRLVAGSTAIASHSQAPVAARPAPPLVIRAHGL